MRSAILFYSSVVMLTAASAETERCPHADGDSCNEWRLERMERELANLIAGPSEWIDGMPAGLQDRARAALNEAQKQWIAFRDAECRRELTWSYATARTERGFIANCRLNMTFHRLESLQKLYKLKP